MKKPRLLTTKEEAIEFLTWVATLESGIVPKAIGSLQEGEGYCCLGVGCILFIPEKHLRFRLSLEFEELQGYSPNDQKNSPTWLKNVSHNFRKRTGISLVEHNDGVCTKEKTHPEIAKMLLKEYKEELNEIFS